MNDEDYSAACSALEKIKTTLNRHWMRKPKVEVEVEMEGGPSEYSPEDATMASPPEDDNMPLEADSGEPVSPDTSIKGDGNKPTAMRFTEYKGRKLGASTPPPRDIGSIAREAMGNSDPVKRGRGRPRKVR